MRSKIIGLSPFATDMFLQFSSSSTKRPKSSISALHFHRRGIASSKGHVQLTTVVVTAIFLFLAVVLGMMVGRGELGAVMRLGFLALMLSYVVFLTDYTWQIALLICFVGLIYRPFNFDFAANEVSAGLAFMLAASYSWRKVAKQKSPFLDSVGLTTVRYLLFIWLLYMVAHFYFNYKAPYSPRDFALSNVAKSYFSVFAPLAVLWQFLVKPEIVFVKPKAFHRIVILCFIGLAVDMSLRLYALFRGLDSALDTAVLKENVYTLRGMGPLAVLLAATLITSPSRKGKAPSLLGSTFLMAGLFGAGISGGRAALALCGLYILTVLVIRRHWKAVLTTCGAFIVVVAFVNLLSREINSSADPLVQRSLQWMLFDKGGSYESIANSSEWRNQLFHRALDEWRSDWRIFWFGRATYGFGVEDEVAVLVSGGYEALMQTSLRRGATHNLVTDLLIAYGLVGCVLYYILIVALSVFLWRIYRRSDGLSESTQNLALVTLLLTVSFLGVATIAGGLFGPDLGWLIIVMVADIVRRPPESNSSRELPTSNIASRPRAYIRPRLVSPVGSR